MSSLLTELENGGAHAYRKFRSALRDSGASPQLVERLDNTPLTEFTEEVDGAPERQNTEHATTYDVTISGNNHLTVIGGTNVNISRR